MLCLACGAEMRLVEVVEDTTMLVSGYEHQTWQCSGCSSVEQRMTFTRKKGQTRRAPVEAAPTAATNASPKPFDEKLRDLMERATALKEAVAESKRRAQFNRNSDKLRSVPLPSASSEALSHKDGDEPVQSPAEPVAPPAPTAHDEPIVSASECARRWSWRELARFGRHKGSSA